MLAKCLCLCIVLASAANADTPVAKDGLQWESDLETAQRHARETNRLVLIHFGGAWCPPCQLLEKNVFSQPGFGRELQSKYVPVKIDVDSNKELAAKYAIQNIPTDVIITASGQLLYKVRSPATAAAYLETMNKVAASALGEASNAVAASAQLAAPAVPKNAQLANDPGDRYADYYRSRQAGASGPAIAAQPSAHRESAVAHEPPRTTAVSMRQAAVATASAAEAKPAATQPQPKVITPTAKAPSNPPVGLDGYCPVTLWEKRVWQSGTKEFGAIHRGRTYLFANEEAQKKFLANPDRYSPVLSGNDPVLRVDRNQEVPGKREHGAFYGDRIYLFASEETFQQFDRDPVRYTVDSRQALRR
jgi:YHS domain-containing protein/thioredoxin-like negative regulator of GroEL